MRRFVSSLAGGLHRNNSTVPPNLLVDVSESPLKGVKIVSMNNGPVNVLTPNLMADLIQTLENLADTTVKKIDGRDTADAIACRGVVLTSSLGGTIEQPASNPVFSSGLDLRLLSSALEKSSFVHYWTQFQRLFVLLNQYPLPIVASINGHAPAAGCILAMCCDYRAMARSAPKAPRQEGGSPEMTTLSIGIGASRAGFAVPPFVAASMSNCVGFHCAERMLQRGTLVTADEALRIGLVDEVADSGDEALVLALAEVDRYLAMPFEHTRWLVKEAMRREVVGILGTHELRMRDCTAFYEMLTMPHVKEALGGYEKKLSKSRA